MKYAFFDVDNTIYDGYTASELITFIEQNESRPGLKEKYSSYLSDYQSRRLDYNQASQLILDLVSELLSGRTRDEALRIVDKMIEQKETIFNDWVSKVLDYLKKDGYQIILVSAGPDIAIEQISQMLEADRYFASKIPISNGKYDGTSVHVLNELEKTKSIKGILGEDDVSIAFGDSTGDIPMMEMADQAFVVENDHHSEMTDYAKEKKWIIFSKAEQVIDNLN